MIEESRKIIIEGLKEFQKACSSIKPEQCHSECPYEDICLKLNCVGWGIGVKIQPCDWVLE